MPDRVLAAPFPEEADISSAWLAEALGHPGVDVSVESRPIGTGQVGENVRYNLRWPDGVAGPASVVGKFPAHDEATRQTAAATGTYVKEIGFYRDLQDTVTIRTPHIHALAEELERNRFLLLMEDIHPAEQGDQLEGCTVEQAELAVDALVGLHAPHWGAATLAGVEWLPQRSPDRGADTAGLYTMVLPGFLARYAERLASPVLHTANEFAGHFETWYAAGRTADTLVHGDYRLDNMLFGSGGAAPSLTVVDWQTTAIGRGASDLAYFIGAGLTRRDRRTSESGLFQRYASGLEAAGVSVDRTDLWHDYVLGSASGLVMAVIASQIVGQTERGDEMFCVMAERHAQQMQDLEIASLLS